MWRVVQSGMATLSEIDSEWSFQDLLKACAVLDFDGAVSEIVNEKKG